MPFTINGFGTRYLGKKNKHELNSSCEYCGEDGVLLDYDTRLWITALFIPVIPLGRKRVLGYCSQCAQCRVLKSSEWEEISQTALSEGMEAMKSKPDDVDSAIQMHATLAELGKRAEAEKMAEHLRDQFGDEAEVQLYLGHWYQAIGNEQEVKRAIEAAHELDPDNPVALRGKAVTQIGEGKLEEAASNLEELKPPSPHYEPQVFFMLAEAFQKQGDHARAHKIFTELLAATPELAQASEFQKAVKKTEKSLQPTQRLLEKKPLYKSSWVQVVAAVTVAVLLFSFASLYRKANRTVHVVNGLMQQIEIQIDDEAITVSPLSRLEVTVGEGEHLVKVLAPKKEIRPEYKFTIESNFWERLFDKTVTVLDPTESAVVVKDVRFYAENPEKAQRHLELLERKHPVVITQFKKLTRFKNIDYPFAEFPEDVEINSSSEKGIEVKKRLLFISKTGLKGFREFFGYAHTQFTAGDLAVRYIGRFLPTEKELEEKKISADMGALLRAYLRFVQKKRQLDKCKPALVHWMLSRPDDFTMAPLFHSAISRLDIADEEIDYLEKVSQKYQTNDAFKYMLATCKESLSETVKLCGTMTSKEPQLDYLNYKMRSVYFSLENYEKSRMYNGKLAVTEENKEHLLVFELFCLMGEKNYEEIEKKLAKYDEEGYGDIYLDEFKFQYYCFHDRLSELDRIVQEWKDVYATNELDNAAEYEITDQFRVAFSKRQYKKAFELMESTNNLDVGYAIKFELLLMLDKDYQPWFSEIRRLEKESNTKFDLSTIHLMLCLKEASDNNMSQAKKWLDKSLYAATEEAFIMTEKVSQLLSAENVTWKELQDLDVSFNIRRLLFAYMGLKHPSLLQDVHQYLSTFRNPSSIGEHLVDQVLTKRMQELETKTAVPEGEKTPMATAE